MKLLYVRIYIRKIPSIRFARAFCAMEISIWKGNQIKIQQANCKIVQLCDIFSISKSIKIVSSWKNTTKMALLAQFFI